MTTRRLFLSMVSDEFRDYRLLLTKDLERSRVEVTTQEKFGNLGATTLEKLDDYIKHCDAVIHLAGDGLGHVPPKPAVDALLVRHPTLLQTLAQYTGLTQSELDQCSYTQWEAYLALFHKVRIHIYRPDPTAPREAGFVANPTEQKLQSAHFERIRKLGRDRDVFLNEERLSSFVLADLNDILPGRESTVAVSATRLPQAATQLIGRETELALLDQAWNDPHTHLVVIRGKGGEGKTSLVATWMAELAHKGWRGAERVLDWSFYSQGTGDQNHATADFCFNRLLTELGDPDPRIGSPEDRAFRLAQLITSMRTLLVLDGLEPLQYPPGAMQGRLKDNGMATFLRAIVANNRGLVVVTSREYVREVEAHYGHAAIDHDLQVLSPLAGAQVLFQAGARRAGPALIEPNDAELQTASLEVHGHALTLFLVGNYLRLIDDTGLGGDIRQRRLIRLTEADHEVKNDRTRPYGHAFKTMEAYERWFAKGDEAAQLQLSVLKMLGLFDGPASAACLKGLRDPPILGLSELWLGKSDRLWDITLNRLREIKLIERGTDGQVDAHPLIREYFAQLLRDEEPQCFRTAHSRLFEHLCENTSYQPDTLDGLQPLYQAIVHGCLAGRQQEACSDVYGDRILRGTDAGGFYSTRRLGAFGADLGAIAAFFDILWSTPSPNLAEPDQAWLLNAAAFRLRALGRLIEASEPMRAALDLRIMQEHWKNAAIAASNLSSLELRLGNLERAVAEARKAIAFADRIDPTDTVQRVGKRAALADALHQWGKVEVDGTSQIDNAGEIDAISQARHLFETAESLQLALGAEFDILYSVSGFRYCDLKIASTERATWRVGFSAVNKMAATSRAEGSAQVSTSGLLSLSPDPIAQLQPLAVSHLDYPETPTSPCTKRTYRLALAEVERRATCTLIWAQRLGFLVDIALDQLTIARTTLYRAILDQQPLSSFGLQPIRAALGSMRRASDLSYLPLTLLTAAASHHLVGEFTTARLLLDEAQQIAERGPMPLHLADVHLHRARLVGSLKPADRQEHWPDIDPKTELAKARALIEKHHYGRRFDELADAEAASEYW